MAIGSNKLIFMYDESGSPFGFTYNGTAYYYIKNLQGDVIAITNASGTVVVEYAYDAWGKLLSVIGDAASTIGQYNPIRYRGYVYDAETGYYYLISRYYDPELCRFISADEADYIEASGSMLSYNLFSYGECNPIRFADPSGHFVCTIIGGIVGGIGGAIAAHLNGEDVGAAFMIGLSTGALAGAAADIAIATGGVGALAIAAIGGAAANSLNYLFSKQVNNKPIDPVDLAIEATVGAVFNMLTFGLGGGSLTKSSGSLIKNIVNNAVETVCENTTRYVAGEIVQKSTQGVIKNIAKNLAYEVTTTSVNWVFAYAFMYRYEEF